EDTRLLWARAGPQAATMNVRRRSRRKAMVLFRPAECRGGPRHSLDRKSELRGECAIVAGLLEAAFRQIAEDERKGRPENGLQPYRRKAEFVERQRRKILRHFVDCRQEAEDDRQERHIGDAGDDRAVPAAPLLAKTAGEGHGKGEREDGSG